MAISFRGTVQTYIGLGNDELVQNLFTIENGLDSLVDVYVRRLAVQLDATVALTTVMPIVSLYRASSVSGGIEIPVKTPLNTSQTSDSNVVFRSTVFDRYPIAATVSTAATWRQFCSKMQSAAEQQQAVDFNVLPTLVERTGNEWVLKPGEYAVVCVDSPDVRANPQNSNNWMIECVWEEDPTISAAYSISGTVTLSGDPVEGVKVVVIEADTTALANPLLKTVETTGPSGTWSALIRAGKVGVAFYQYIDGAVYFTSDNAVAVTSLESTGDAILNAISSLNDISTADAQTAVAAALTAYDPPTRAEATDDATAIITQVDANETKIDALQVLVDEMHKILGLNASAPATTTPTAVTAGSVNIAVTGDGTTSTTLTRQ